MGLELPGVTRIDTPAQARAHGRSWARMARELDTPDAPEEAKDKARELRQRSKAAHDWARGEEDALLRGQHAHDEQAAGDEDDGEGPVDNVVPLHPEQESAQPAKRRRSSRAARAAGNCVYRAAKPKAMRSVVRGRQHFFQGLSAPFGAAAGGGDLFMEALGLTVAVILIADLLRSPGAIVDVSSHGLGFLQRAAGLVDPITGATVAAPSARPAAASTRVTGATVAAPSARPAAASTRVVITPLTPAAVAAHTAS